LSIGACILPHHLGVIGYLAASCATLGAALEQFQRYQPLIHNLSHMLTGAHDSETDDHWKLSWDACGSRSTQMSDEVLVSALLALARTLTGRADIAPLRVDFPAAAPEDVGAYRQALACPVHFNCKSLAMLFSHAVLACPIKSHDPQLMAVLGQQADLLLHMVPQPDGLMARVQRCIVESLETAETTADHVAAAMGMSARTLQHQLQLRGLHFHGLLTDVRCDLARRYLADRRLSLTEIALLLGYSEQSAFTRAFKGWTGLAPLRYRRAHADGIRPDALRLRPSMAAR
jgi:AraC-like DNA-binding protein